ncbi:MAG TPA: endonuclease/exonuclease/phosphatase family protein [Steroidobacteraceae bacterium]|nr:endonuclease/exonuclease/phosphatase family protein [Steroidobacteraceae bacterium]
MNAHPRDSEAVATEQGESSSATHRTLRIATYNIHRCVGLDGRCDPGRIATVIRELDCDAIGLQEVDNTPGPAPTSMQLDFLASASAMQAVAGLRILRHYGHYGNALLTRHPVRVVRRHDLSFSWREPRGALDVEVEVHGAAVRFIVTHLGLTPGERRHQMRKILEIVGDIAATSPVVLLGDINEWLPLGRPLRWLHAIFGRRPAPRSFPAAWPLFALDRIWASPRANLLVVRAHRSPCSRVASDHLPVIATMEVPVTAGSSSSD